MQQLSFDELTAKIVSLIDRARSSVALKINEELVRTYWEIGRIIVEHEQEGRTKAEYGTQLISELSKKLTHDMGRGFSRSNLANMRAFYLTFPTFQTLSGKLSWSHYCELLGVKDTDARSFYEHEAVNSNWSVREMKRQIGTSLFERLLLSDGKANKDTVLSLSKQGISMSKPHDILRDPYVFEFLGMREEKPILEKELEARLIRHIEDFLLELGRGFMFVGSQQRITLGNVHYYVDMVFYNKILKAYVLIDLKSGAFQAEYAGQMNMYLNYYKTEVNDEADNEPIGIILCKSNDEIVAEYALGGMSNQVFASRYVYYIPEKEQLINEVRTMLKLDCLG